MYFADLIVRDWLKPDIRSEQDHEQDQQARYCESKQSRAESRIRE